MSGQFLMIGYQDIMKSYHGEDGDKTLTSDHAINGNGDISSNVLILASTENGVEIRVPVFVNESDKIEVDTRTGE